MTKFRNDLAQSLSEVLAHLRGKGTAIVHKPLSPIEVRKQARLT